MKLLKTNPHSWAALLARLTLGIVVFPHGAQKLLGWFGGYGYTGTMGYLTTQVGLPYFLALLVILIEFAGSIFLILGFLTRVVAFAMFFLFLGIIITAHLPNGFFMNWTGAQKGEGYEFHLLILGLCLVLLVLGGGKWSTDASIALRRYRQ